MDIYPHLNAFLIYLNKIHEKLILFTILLVEERVRAFLLYSEKRKKMNTVSLIGRLVKDVELRDIGESRFVTNNVLAVRKAFKKEGAVDADFIPFVAWGKKAEILEKHCSKGDLIALSGKMQSRSYQTSEEETKYVVEMLVDEIEFIQKKAKD